MSRRSKFAKHDKPLTVDEMKPKERDFGHASRPILKGSVVRTAKSRKFEPKRAKLEDCHVSYSEAGERKVHDPNKQRYRKVKWGGKTYSVPIEIAG